MMVTRRSAAGLFTACGMLAVTGRVRAGAVDWVRPIHLIVPSAPGGIYDAVGRVWADRVRAGLTTIIVENQSGAGGSVGAALVAHAQGDGYTILLCGLISNVIVAVASRSRAYDPKALDPISLLGSNSYAFAAAENLPVSTIAQLVEYGRAHRGTLVYGTAGVGSLNHLTGELFKFQSGLTAMSHIPYRGAGPALIDLLGEQIPMAVVSATRQMVDLHREGKIRILAVTSRRRLTFAPEIPTMTESGYPEVDTQQYIGLFGPPATRVAAVEGVADGTRLIVDDKAYRDRMTLAGLDVFPDSSPEAMRAVDEQLYAKWTPIIKEIGLQVD